MTAGYYSGRHDLNARLSESARLVALVAERAEALAAALGWPSSALRLRHGRVCVPFTLGDSSGSFMVSGWHLAGDGRRHLLGRSLAEARHALALLDPAGPWSASPA